jgi:transposase InsO family protein
MIHKNETVHKLKSFIADIKILKMKLKIYDNLMVFKSDNGGEFVGEESTQMLLDNLVAQELTSPHTPGQNGIAERSNRTIGEATVACMIAAKAPNHLWDYAMMNVLHVENLLPTEVFENKHVKSNSLHALYVRTPCILYMYMSVTAVTLFTIIFHN